MQREGSRLPHKSAWRKGRFVGCGEESSSRAQQELVRVSMNKKLFRELVESMTQMNEIVRGKRAPSRKFQVDAIAIKALRAKIGLSQPKFAALLNVDVGTLRNWEQGRREPTGPAKALLTAISRDPTHVLKALAA